MENGDKKTTDENKAKERKPNNPNILSSLFVWWMCPVFLTGNKRDLEEEDLIVPTNKYDSEQLGAYFERTVQPMLFAELLSYWSVDSNMTRYDAGFYALAMLGLNFVAVMCQHHNSLFVARFGLKIKVATSSLIFRKLLRMSQVASGDIAGGKLVNLLSNDVARFDYAFMFLHNLWVIPIQAAVVLYFLYVAAGYAPFVGLFFVILLILPLQAALTKLTAIIRRDVAQKTDRRIKLMSEIINGIQVIKMYAWEKPFQLVVKAARALEMRALRKSIFIRSVFLGFMLFTERTILFVTTLTLVLTGNIITATLIYPIQQYFSIIQMNLTMILPIAIASFSEMLVSLERVQSFLEMEEREDLARTPKSNGIINRITFNSKNGKNKETDIVMPQSYSKKDNFMRTQSIEQNPRRESLAGQYAIELNRISASWTTSTDPADLTLRNISLRLGAGKLCAIIGPVGSGKSSILQAILRELPLSEGNVNIKGRISYACQESWLFPDTVRENILFGLPYDARKYQEVCKTCCLLPDFKQFPYGDLSLVGERGVSLSGGQRARINLARAIYREADIYLLDDPLSAVDANVGRQLFDGCIRGYLKDRTCILVTHQVHYVKAADVIVVLNEGRIENIGTYNELIESGKEFSKLLSNQESDKDDNDASEGKRPSIQRGISKISTKSGDTPEGEKAQVLTSEERTKGNLKWEVVYKYLTSVGSWFIVFLALLTLLITQASATMADYWLSYWTNQVDQYEQSLGEEEEPGRVLNRFSKDLGAMDEFLPRSILETVQMYLSMTSILVLNAIALPWTLIPTVILMIIFIFFLKWYLNAAQAVKRLEGTTKSPVFGMINSTLSGLSTIRSSNSQNRLLNMFDSAQNLHSSAFYTFVGGANAFGLYLDALCLVYLGIILGIFLGIDFSTIIPVGSVGLAVSQSMILTMMLQMAARFTADFLGQMTAVERVLEYTHLPTEDNMDDGPIKPADHWPPKGKIEFRNVFLNYGPEDPSVLKNLNFEIQEGWKVGVVGRTGAGKSSLISALFRLYNIQGSITIDGLDTDGIAKARLRSKISIIPQEPVLFSATLRYNLDPFNSYSDDEIWRALEQVELKEVVPALDYKVTEGGSNFSMGQRQLVCLARAILRSNKILVMDEATANVELKEVVPALDYKVTEGGSNFSMGQRQLVCLARAILRSNKILVMDEATANVDPQTDALIQKTIRRQFATCTVITIAHRLNTIMDSDRVLVMDKGSVVEFDHPHILLSDPNSSFSSMASCNTQNTHSCPVIQFTRLHSENHATPRVGSGQGARYWFEECERATKEKRKPSLWKAMRRAYWLAFMPGAFFVLTGAVCGTVQPMLFAELLSYWSVDSTMSRYDAGFYALAMLGLNFVAVMCQHHNSLFVARFGMRIKVATSSLIFRKLLRMSQVASGDIAGGKLVNLLSNDVARFDYAFMFLHSLWVIPIQAAVVLYFLYNAAGYAPFIGLFSVVLMILPIQAALTKLTAIIRREVAQKTDRRIKLMSEIINGIQVIKMYAWEKPFQLVVKTARALEMRALRKSIFIRSVFLGFMLFTERTILFVTTLTLVLTGNIITATLIYPIQQYFSLIQINLTMIFPLAIASFSEMLVSLERVQGFLEMEEREDLERTPKFNGIINKVTFNSKDYKNKEMDIVMPQSYSKKDDFTRTHSIAILKELPLSEGNVNIKGRISYACQESWLFPDTVRENILFGLPYDVRKYQESSILQAILKELPLSEGNVNIKGRISYACQESWLFPDTVRENILFGLPYDVRKYQEVCKTCCLLPDFKQFPYGDLSLVGERGVSLSGGQRARINLARAIYREADIYLLDDPLSAVDANVGRQLFDGCIRGYLNDRTCILVTHQIHYVKAADVIVVLNEGRIENIGTYDELIKSGKEFSQLLSNQESNQDDNDASGGKRPSMHRGISKISTKSGDTSEVEKAQVLTSEERTKGNLKWEVVYKYLTSVGSWFIVFLAFLTLLITQASATTADYWLSYWTNQVDQYEQSLGEGVEPDSSLGTVMGTLTTGQYLIVYGSVIVGLIVISHIRIINFVIMTMKASENLHNTVYKKLIISVMRFFDTNPSVEHCERMTSGISKSVPQYFNLQLHNKLLNKHGYLDGRIENIGTYDELIKSGKEFSQLLSNQESNQDDNDASGGKRPSMHRGISKISTKSGDTSEVEKTQVLTSEERTKGNLKWEVVYKYLTSVGSWFIVFLAFLTLLITQASATTADYWLSYWTNQVDQYEQSLGEGVEPDSSLGTVMGTLTTGQYLIVYGSVIVGLIVISHIRIINFVIMTMKASENLHNTVYKKLIISVMRFFDTNPSGRVLNRFSKDFGAMDEFLPRSILETVQMYLSMTSILVLNAIALPWTLIPTVILIIIFVLLLKWYLNAAQAVKRLEGTTKSPVFGMINSTLSGLSTIRSSNSQNRLLNMFDSAQNLHTSAFYTFVGGSNAFGLYLDALCLVYLGIIFAIFLVIDFSTIIPVGSVGLAVSQSMILTMMLQLAARFTADFLGQMTAVERVLEYTHLPTEDNMDDGPIKPAENWPPKGKIEFRNVFLNYGPEDPPVLKNLNFEIQEGWKVGVVGRTGAGKSSLISALFRLYNIQGSITIDGLDTDGIAKARLRSKISIIPQEPVLFSATLRYNLDPFNSYSDDEIWRALEQVELKEVVPALDYKVTEGGSNFSMGQRQLVCLARAILRSNKILVMDEATANVDPQTDALIQKTIRRQFATCTVITIAHRLNTIMDSDRVLVMDKGSVVEFDHPHILLSNPNSSFSSMVRETGEGMTRVLKDVAKNKYLSDYPDAEK
ncbi:hypothetical protein O3G_MSEX012378 [Manduca sexta]|uniref:Uncharacterized protein n=1 Tax=Manduca sexta TaxID=7130 RepID=A0A922CVG0_MANSE|nr:hypothetical protein O3G_MSEX012378 [Manduca sexta]